MQGVVVVVGMVAGRRHNDGAAFARELDGVLQGWVVSVGAPARVDHLRPLGHGVRDGAHGVGGHDVALGRDDLQREDVRVPVDPRDAHSVVASRRDDARDVGAVADRVHRIVGTGEEVPTRQVVDQPVAVVVETVLPGAAEEIAGVDVAVPVLVRDEIGVVRAARAVQHHVAIGVERVEVVEVDEAVLVGVDDLGTYGRWDLALVDGHGQVEVGVGVVDAGVQNRDQGRGGSGRQIPGRGGVDVDSGIVVQGPLVYELGIVGDQLGKLHPFVLLSVAHLREVLQQLHGAREVGSGSQDHLRNPAVEPALGD